MKALHFILIILSAALCAVPAPAWADNNEELYDAVAPADSAFVRLLNTHRQPENFSIGGFSKSLLVGAAQVSPYLFLPSGDYQFNAGTATLTLNLPKHHAVTLVFDGEKIVPINDQMPENAQRALVAFYNLSGSDSALKTADGRFDLVTALPPRSAGFREINEVRMAFAAYDEARQQAVFEPLLLRKGRSYSFIIIDDGNNNLRNLATINQIDSPN